MNKKAGKKVRSLLALILFLGLLINFAIKFFYNKELIQMAGFRWGFWMVVMDFSLAAVLVDMFTQERQGKLTLVKLALLVLGCAKFLLLGGVLYYGLVKLRLPPGAFSGGAFAGLVVFVVSLALVYLQTVRAAENSVVQN